MDVDPNYDPSDFLVAGASIKKEIITTDQPEIDPYNEMENVTYIDKSLHYDETGGVSYQIESGSVYSGTGAYEFENPAPFIQQQQINEFTFKVTFNYNIVRYILLLFSFRLVSFIGRKYHTTIFNGHLSVSFYYKYKYGTVN